MKVKHDERTEIARTLRQAVENSDLSQAAFARAIGTSPARLHAYLAGTTIPSAALYLRALGMGGALKAARSRGLMTPNDTADLVNKALRRGDEDWAFRMLLQARDDLRLAEREEEGDLLAWKYRAKAINDERFDTLFRAIIAHEFGETVPDWTAGAKLDEDWIKEDPFRDEETIRRQTPDWLADARIFISERGLATA